MIPHDEPIPQELLRTATIKALPDQEYGANMITEEEDYKRALQQARMAVQGALSIAQLRLLLRGEKTLQRKFLKALGPKAQAGVMQAAAARYGMKWVEKRPDAKQERKTEPSGRPTPAAKQQPQRC